MRTHLPLLLLLAGCAHPSASQGMRDRYQAIVDAPDRLAGDRALDAGRKPVAFLEFLDLRPGMRAAELFAAGGYTTELMARAVAPEGVVYGQNSRFILERFAEKPWSARLSRSSMKNVVRVDRELDDPLPAEASNLDVVVSNAIYHDTVWQKVDRRRMNEAVLRALKPHGAYVVCDSSAKPGTGTRDVETLHRIDEQAVVDEVTKAGFLLGARGDFLRNSEDTRDWSSSPVAAGARRGTSDRFCIRFLKP